MLVPVRVVPALVLAAVDSTFKMMSRIIKSILIVFIAAFIIPGSSAAQDYSFILDEQIVDVYLEPDGSISIDYVFAFRNHVTGAPIDFIDVGLPNNDFDLSSIRASINGDPITDITYSPYVTYGIALGLGDLSIQPGSSGMIILNIPSIQNPYYLDSQDENYASFQFSPTWFDPAYVTGTTLVDVTFHLPQDVQPDEPRWHGAPSGFSEEPETGFDEAGRIFYRWVNPSANGHTQYIFGASIPRKYVIQTVRLVSEDVNVFMEENGQVHVDYQIELVNESSSSELSSYYVDIPSVDYSISNMGAEINGHPAFVFDEYDYANISFQEAPIDPTQAGVITFSYDLVDLVYSSTWFDDKYTLATLIFSPDVPDSPFIIGPEALSLTFHLPAGLSVDGISYDSPSTFSTEPVHGTDTSSRSTISWTAYDIDAHSDLETEIQFPREYVPDAAIYDYPKPPFHTRLGISDGAFYGTIIIGGIIAAVALIIIAVVAVERNRKLKYLPPKIRTA